MNNIAARVALSAWSTRARAVLRMRVNTAGRATHCLTGFNLCLNLSVFRGENSHSCRNILTSCDCGEGNGGIEAKFRLLEREHSHSSVLWHLLCACATSGARHLCEFVKFRPGVMWLALTAVKLFSQHTWPHTLNITAFTVRAAALDSIFRHLEDSISL